MKKYIFTIIISLLVGFLLANFMLKQYEGGKSIIPVFGKSETAYLIQQGVYSSSENMKQNTGDLPYYIYSLIDNMYYVYIGMSLDENNIKKIQSYYDDLGITTIVKTTTLTDNSFIEALRQYDTILTETNDKDTIKEVCKQILSKYEGG